MSYDKQFEQIGTPIDMGDMALLAEFYAERFVERVRSSSKELRETTRQEADKMARAASIIKDLASHNVNTLEETLKILTELEEGYNSEMKDAASEEPVSLEQGLDGVLKARSFLEENRDFDMTQRKDFLDWLKTRNIKTRENREQESHSLTIDEIDEIFSDDATVRDIEKLQRIITPEVRNSILSHVIDAIDAKIEQGKRLAEKEKGTAVEAKNMAHVLGQESMGRRYQLIANASEGRILDAAEMGRMSIYDFLKRYLGYDLRLDESRREDLKRYTNMLD